MDARKRLLSQIEAHGLARAQETERSRQSYATIKANLLRQIKGNYETEKNTDSSSSSDEAEDEDCQDGEETERKLSTTDTDSWAPRWRTLLASQGDVRWLKQLKRKECIYFKPKCAKGKICFCGRREEDHEIDWVDGEAAGQRGPWRRENSIVQKETDTWGRISYEEDPIPSLYLRLDDKTSEEALMYLAHDILNVTSNDLYIHFLDYEESLECMDVRVVSRLQDKLRTGLKVLTEKTHLLLTSQGMKTGVSKHLHVALSKLNKTHSLHPITIACSPWGSVECKGLFKDTATSTQEVRPGKRCSPDSLGNLSPFFTHHLFVDDGTHNTVPKHLLKFVEKLNNTFERFHGLDCRPSVQVLMNGADKTLDHVINALKQNIPLIVVNGSGGIADEIAMACRSSKQKRHKTLDFCGNVSLKYTLPTPNLRSKPDREAKIKQVLNSFDLVTILDPEPQTLGLDMVIVWALLKAKQNSKLERLFESFHSNYPGLWQPIFTLNLEKPESCALNPHTYFLLEAMFDNSAAVVEAIIKGLNLKQHFTMDNIVQLYNRYDSLGPCKAFLKKAKEQNSKITGCHQSLTTLTDVRSALRIILGGSYPLACTGRGCQCQCVAKPSNIQVVLSDPKDFRSCLPPIQEMFLWALLTNTQKLARMLWNLCEDKIASALVGEVVLRKLAEKEENLDKEAELMKNAEEFEELAVGILKKCSQFDEEDSHKLLLMRTRWWGGRSCLQLAIQFQSQRVISQQACMSLINKVWYGCIVPSKNPLLKFLSMALVFFPWLSMPFLKITKKEILGFSADESMDDSSKCKSLILFYRAPVVKYTLNLLMFITFLGLFSYMLLVDLQPDFTLCQGILCGWVATYLGEEIRQILTIRETSLTLKVKEYFNQFWNILDGIMILLFGVGMLLALAPVEPWYQVRHVLLNLDIFVCAMRLMQMFVVKKTLGPMFTMIQRMISDTVSFMTILLVFVIFYGVVSHSILYPRDKTGWGLLYKVPREAYWQIYGEFFLEDIPGSDACNQNNSSSVFPNQDCSSKYIAEVLLALYAIITHVLLLNILIAKFNHTFAKVQGEATKIWAWHRCQIIYEFYNRPWLPPPFNIIYFLYWVTSTLMRKVYHQCMKCCCKKRHRRRQLRRDDTTTFLLKEKGKSPGIGKGRVTNNSIQIVWDQHELKQYTLYFIEYTEAPWCNNPITMRMCATRSCVVNDLRPDTKYAFKMYGSVEEDNGQSSTRELVHSMDIKTMPYSESERLSKIETDVVKWYISSITSKDVSIQKTEELSHKLSDLVKSSTTAQQASAGTLEQLSKDMELLRNGQMDTMITLESYLHQQESSSEDRESSEEQNETKTDQLNTTVMTRLEGLEKCVEENLGHGDMVGGVQERLGRLEKSVSDMKDNQERLIQYLQDLISNR